MQSTTRLKLGPKRKDFNAFQRLHKLQQNGNEYQNLPQYRMADLNASSSSNVSKNHKNNEINEIKSPRSILIQLNTTTTAQSLEKTNALSYSNALNNRQEHKPSIETPEIEKKNVELQSNFAFLQKQNEQLKIESDKKMKQNRQLSIKGKEMEQKISKLSQQNQKLKNNEKILKVEINNFDKNHYEQQINRLKAQCQKLQIQTIEKSHKQKMAEESAKDAQSQINKKNEEIKGLQKIIEKQKMGGAQARSKINEKDRCLRIAFEQSEAANQFLCKNIEELTKQLQRQEKMRKQKDSHIDSLNVQISTLVNRQKNNEAKIIQMKKSYQDCILQQNKKFATYQEEETEKLRESQTLIHRLSSDIQSLKNEHNEKLVTSKITNESQKNQLISQKELYIVRLEQQLKQSKVQLEGRDKLIQNIQERLKTYYSPEQYKNLQARFKQIEQKRLTSARYYQQKLYNYQKENDKLRLEKINKAPEIETENGSFDHILKQTLEQSNVLRSQLKRMSQSLTSYKEEASEIRLRQKNYLNELEILRKKSQSSSKNFQIELQVQKQKLINEIQSLRRKLSTVETRLQYKISQNKQKDDFIKSVIVGKSELSQRSIVLAELQRIFLERDRQQSANGLT